MHEVLVYHLVKLAKEKGVVWIYHSQTRRHVINVDSELLKSFGFMNIRTLVKSA